MRDGEAISSFRYLPMDVVHLGRGAVVQLEAERARLNASRVIVVTSPSVKARTDAIDRVAQVLGGNLCGIFSGVRPHVPYECLQPGLDMAWSSGADLLVSVGGGSAVDAARALALCIGEGIRDVHELEAFRARFVPPSTTTLPATSGRALPHIAVPLTLSAAEFANAGAVTSVERKVKDLLIADELTPRAVILDPELSVQTPIALWCSTGMRALDHAIETVYSPNGSPVTETLSLEAIRQLSRSLRDANAAFDDVAARARGHAGAWMSYFGEMNLTLGLSHAIGHQLGARFGMQHGLTSCVILPQVIRFVGPVVEPQLEMVATALGVPVPMIKALGAAEAAANAVETLAADLGLPLRLRQLGVTPDSFSSLAEAVLDDLVVAGSPRPVSAEQVIAILKDAA